MEEKRTSAPKSPLRKRILYRLFKWCGLTTYGIEQALRNRLWNGIQIGASKYLGHCPYHHEERLQETGRGYFVCALCNNSLLWLGDSEPVTDKMERPMQTFLHARQEGVGVSTAMNRAIPRRTVRLDSPDQDRR